MKNHISIILILLLYVILGGCDNIVFEDGIKSDMWINQNKPDTNFAASDFINIETVWNDFNNGNDNTLTHNDIDSLIELYNPFDTYSSKNHTL